MGIAGRRTMLVSEDDNALDEVDLRPAIFQMDADMDTSAKNDSASYHGSPQETSPGRRSSAGRATDS